jgi:hypothetical protein
MESLYTKFLVNLIIFPSILKSVAYENSVKAKKRVAGCRTLCGVAACRTLGASPERGLDSPVRASRRRCRLRGRIFCCSLLAFNPGSRPLRRNPTRVELFLQQSAVEGMRMCLQQMHGQSQLSRPGWVPGARDRQAARLCLHRRPSEIECAIVHRADCATITSIPQRKRDNGPLLRRANRFRSLKRWRIG